MAAPRECIAMPLTFAAAAALCGVDKSTIRRAARAGRISASRHDNGVWDVEPVELHRVFPPLASPLGMPPNPPPDPASATLLADLTAPRPESTPAPHARRR